MANKRDKFESVYKWNTKDLYKSDTDCKKELNKLSKEIKKLSNYKGKILENANTFLEALELDTNISKKLERAYIYAHINNDADTLDPNYQELYGIAKNVYASYLEKSSYIIPEILKSDYALISKYIKENKKLKDYERNLKEIFRSKNHILADDIEEVISKFSKIASIPEEVMSSLTDSDFKFDPIKVDGKLVELTESNFSIYLRHKNREVRKEAFESIYKTYKSYKTTLATTLRSEVEKNVVMAKLRNYKNSLERSLFNDDIKPIVYKNLIDSVHNNLGTLYKYWDLKKKNMNLSEFHLYDAYADTSISEDKKYTFEEAKNLVLNAVKPLGEDYVRNISKSFTDGWIDSCNNEGKRGGAYCTSCYEVHPYVLMSYEGLLNDVSTLSHELGHAMHYFYACKNQKYQDYNYSIFVAEVASQVNEILLSRYLLLNSKSKNEKIKIIDDLLQKYKSTIYRQTMFAEFELFIHEYTEKGGVLTSDVMCDKYYELNKLYFGESVYVDDLIRYEWERIPHFYMNFYVWEYATGFAAAIKIANDIFDGNKERKEKYLEFLKLGSTKKPIPSLKVAGIDMTKNEVMDDAINFMEKLLDEYQSLQGSDKHE